MMGVLAWAWVLPLPGLVLTGLGVPASRRYAGYASVPGPFVLLVLAVAALLSGGQTAVEVPNWLPFLSDGSYRALADALSALMLAILGFVAALVYVYSLGYMADDPSRRRFFVYLDLFVATMALLVLAGNLAVLLIGWTGVGISSFLLISFWRDRPGTLGAGLQALAANAVGDGALLLAAALVPTGCGALTTLHTPQCSGGPGGAELLALLLFVAAAAKSAQGPLYFWLPNAMAGPTPISALIHAATMVAAGVYLLVRTHALIDAAPTTSAWIAGVGVATALAASVLSLLQTNFKKGIAYSTVAQLGYMFAGVGVGAPFAGLFHLFTHAAFKALLFLSAGVVIHGAAGQESLSALRGLGRGFRFSWWGFLIGSLALIGTPIVTAGSFSKDAIIDAALSSSRPIVGWLLLGGVLLTGLYIGRLFSIVYLAPAVDEHAVHHDPSSERLMDWALVPLAVGAIVFGYAGAWLSGLLNEPLGASEPLPGLVTLLGLAAFALGAIGFAISWWIVTQRPALAAAPQPEVGSPYRAAPWVSALAKASYAVSDGLARVQSGLLARYALGSFVAVAVILLAREMSRS